jgi:oligopeptide/dipeptide ABC transporter ATP-binding protein
MADDVVVMYGGSVVERGDVASVLSRPRHPYTIGLLNSIPGARGRLPGARRLQAIPGGMPDPRRRPKGCLFAPRCGFAIDACRSTVPPLEETRVGDGLPSHATRCIRWADVTA